VVRSPRLGWRCRHRLKAGLLNQQVACSSCTMDCNGGNRAERNTEKLPEKRRLEGDLGFRGKVAKGGAPACPRLQPVMADELDTTVRAFPTRPVPGIRPCGEGKPPGQTGRRSKHGREKFVSHSPGYFLTATLLAGQAGGRPADAPSRGPRLVLLNRRRYTLGRPGRLPPQGRRAPCSHHHRRNRRLVRRQVRPAHTCTTAATPSPPNDPPNPPPRKSSTARMINGRPVNGQISPAGR